MGKFVSPGVYVKEVDISTWIVYKNIQRKKKIAKILGIDYSPNVIITSTPKGGPVNFPQIW
jgi:hypothetical protein